MPIAIINSFIFIFINRRITRKTEREFAGVFVLLVVYGIMLDFSFHTLLCSIIDDSFRRFELAYFHLINLL